jgi:hypothetical protein
MEILASMYLLWCHQVRRDWRGAAGGLGAFGEVAARADVVVR